VRDWGRYSRSPRRGTPPWDGTRESSAARATRASARLREEQRGSDARRASPRWRARPQELGCRNNTGVVDLPLALGEGEQSQPCFLPAFGLCSCSTEWVVDPSGRGTPGGLTRSPACATAASAEHGGRDTEVSQAEGLTVVPRELLSAFSPQRSALHKKFLTHCLAKSVICLAFIHATLPWRKQDAAPPADGCWCRLHAALEGTSPKRRRELSFPPLYRPR